MTAYKKLRSENDTLRQELTDTKRLIRDYVCNKRNAGTIKALAEIVENINEVDRIANKHDKNHSLIKK